MQCSRVKLKLNFILLLLGYATLVCAQSTATITLSQDTVQVGEIFTGTLKYNTTKNLKLKGIDLTGLFNPKTLINAITAGDSSKINDLPDFEITSLGAWDGHFDKKFVNNNSINWVTEADGVRKSYSNEIKLIFWDPGVYVLNGGDLIPLDTLDRGAILPIEGSMLLVAVPEVFLDTTQAIQLRPIKGIIREARNWTDYFALYGLGLFLIFSLIGFYIYKTRSKDKQLAQEKEIYIPPAHTLALEKLTALDKQQLWQKGEIKTFQSSLTRIIREYLGNRYQINALEMTTDQISRSLKSRNFDFNYEDKLRRILTMADLIKFAKAKPPADIHQQFYNTAEQFIHDTKQTEMLPFNEEEE